jgi:tRNA (guanine37-N1)-methyltransferase
VHDLREWAHDRHRTVDDTPYGGGAGMVMKPEPWGEVLDQLRGEGRPTLVVPTPSGVPFTQQVARELAAVDHLVFACGRYEGIDQRVLDEAATSYDLRELSLGDFVLNGGEVATAAVIEAVVRLLPGFMGNPESLAEESHEDGLLEYPVYTKPASWRGREVPAVLLSGDHAAIAAWRRSESVRRTVARRPDLAHPSAAVGVGGLELEVRLATRADVGELFTLTRACWLQELWANPGAFIPALAETVEDAVRGMEDWTTFVALAGGRIVGSTRGRLAGDGTVWDVGRVMVAPDLQGRGLGRYLLRLVEDAAPAEVTSYELMTGAHSVDNLRTYKKAGYRLRGPAPGPAGAVLLTKPRPL